MVSKAACCQLRDSGFHSGGGHIFMNTQKSVIWAKDDYASPISCQPLELLDKGGRIWSSGSNLSVCLNCMEIREGQPYLCARKTPLLCLRDDYMECMLTLWRNFVFYFRVLLQDAPIYLMQLFLILFTHSCLLQQKKKINFFKMQTSICGNEDTKSTYLWHITKIIHTSAYFDPNKLYQILKTKNLEYLIPCENQLRRLDAISACVHGVF